MQLRHAGVLGAPQSRALCINVRCAGKGFGASTAKPASDGGKGARRRQQEGQTPVQIDGTLPQDKAVRDAVEEAKARSRGLGVRPIDPKEAAKGKLDYVQVQDWGTGAQEDLGNLKVQAVSERYGTELDSKPFYEQLARQLELAESRGELRVASAPGSQPVPPFKRWSFSLSRYLQYLADAAAVHGALEAAMAHALAAGSNSSTVMPTISSTTNAGVTSTAPAVVDSTTPVQLDSTSSSTIPDGPSTSGAAPLHNVHGLDAALAALASFGANQGLDRQQYIEQDLQALLCSSSSSSSSTTSTSSSRDGGAGASSTSSAGSGGIARPRAGGNARAYAAYLTKQGERAAGEGVDSKQEQEEAALRLFAGAYAVHASHLGGGVRIGAAATEKLGLFAKGATQTYQVYPASVADPLKKLVEGVNAAGLVLGQEQRQVVFDELPRVMVKTGMLLEALAHED